MVKPLLSLKKDPEVSLADEYLGELIDRLYIHYMLNKDLINLTKNFDTEDKFFVMDMAEELPVYLIAGSKEEIEDILSLPDNILSLLFKWIKIENKFTEVFDLMKDSNSTFIDLGINAKRVNEVKLIFNMGE